MSRVRAGLGGGAGERWKSTLRTAPPSIPRLVSDIERARTLVLRHGWNATSYQILNPGIDLWFSDSGDAVVGYAARHGMWVAAGAPICELSRLLGVAGEFEEAARLAGCRVCYFGAESRFHRLRAGDGSHGSTLIGAQPGWPPDEWARMLATHASLRQQLNRSQNKGVTVEEWDAGRATGSPELAGCLREWLDARGLPPLHFLVEPRTLSRLDDRRVFVASRDSRVEAFLVASPIPARGGWLIEQVVRGATAPNGTAELLIDAAVRAMVEAGDRYVTLGLAPLSRRAGAPGQHGPRWLRLLFAWTRAHVHRFYNFEGLESFKAKFRPAVWEPVYLISDRPSVDAHTLHAVAAAFSDRSVPSTVGRALWSAVRQETRWLVASRKRPRD